jgi:hypothetical protein
VKSRCIDTGTAYTSSFLRSLPGQCYIFCVDAGVGVEGILRQCADVDDVDRRVKEYEQGRNQFTPDEDAHVISDCIKHVLRKLPSPPVSAPCCTALLEAHRKIFPLILVLLPPSRLWF